MLRAETMGAHGRIFIGARALCPVFVSFSHLPAVVRTLSSPPLSSLDVAGPLIALNMVTILFKLILG
jgi:hypothetical protein